METLNRSVCYLEKIIILIYNFFFFKAQSSEITVMEQLVGLLVRDNQVPLSFGSSNI